MYLALNLILALIWVGLTGDVSIGNVIFGLLLSLLLVGYTQRVINFTPPRNADKSYLSHVLHITYFILYFLKELVLASLNVVITILMPHSRLRPGVIAVPLDLTTDTEITLLANLITLTPGTLTLDVSSDRKVIYVHAMFVTDPEAFRFNIKNGFEKRVMEVLR